MRYAIAAALSALVTLATVSVASAQNDQKVSAPSRATTNPVPKVRDNAPPAVGDNNANVLTREQEIAIPYRPCIQAIGWVNGHLVCNN
jgi:hypothetical protein